jgi:hypothetical protein
MIDTHKTRQKAETELVEFLAALKYYSDKWERARFYAQMCDFVKPQTQQLHGDNSQLLDIYC